MTQLFHPELANDPFGDPGLYVDLQHRNHALLFDLGDLSNLPARKLNRIRHVFVTHTHMDHFCGFDQLLRVCLGQPRRLHVTGPAGLIGHVENKLGGYIWNLADETSVNAEIEVSDYSGDGRLHSALFRFRTGFRRQDLAERLASGGRILETPGYHVQAVHLDHHIPCLGFAVEERQRLNVWRTRLEEMQLGVGPWLDELKQAMLDDADGDTMITARWRAGDEDHQAVHALSALKHLVQITPGQKIAYVTDVGYTPDNKDRIIALAAQADCLFIESAFMEADAEMALQKMHLTARQAGEIARLARVRRFEQFHFSPRYEGLADQLIAEAKAEAEAGGAADHKLEG